MADFKNAQRVVGLNEGAYQADPRDSGNFYNGTLIGTNWGISAPTLATYLGRTPTASEMKQLTKALAEEILKQRYWLKNKLDQLKNQSVATLVYDGVVNHGTNGMRFLVEKAVRMLGGSLDYHQAFTEKGIQYLNRFNQKKLFYALKKVRSEKYQKSGQTHFVQGWLNRLARIHYYANNTFSALWPYVASLMGVIGVLLLVV